MRYWHPLTARSGARGQGVAAGRDRLLPLYPQYLDDDDGVVAGGVATGSGARQGLDRPTRIVCCYPAEPGFIEALAGQIAAGARAAMAGHGSLPRCC